MRDAPIVAIPETQPLDRDVVNRIVVDANLRYDKLYDTLIALDARLQALGG